MSDFSDIVRIICAGDTEIIDEAAGIIRDGGEYGYYEIIGTLQANDYACSIDVNFPAEDILYNLQNVADKLELDMEACPVDRESTSLEALRGIAEFLAARHYALGQLYSGGDSYVLFLVNEGRKEELLALARQEDDDLIDFEFAD
jgi:hypothetical protein